MPLTENICTAGNQTLGVILEEITDPEKFGQFLSDIDGSYTVRNRDQGAESKAILSRDQAAIRICLYTPKAYKAFSQAGDDDVRPLDDFLEGDEATASDKLERFLESNIAQQTAIAESGIGSASNYYFEATKGVVDVLESQRIITSEDAELLKERIVRRTQPHMPVAAGSANGLARK